LHDLHTFEHRLIWLYTWRQQARKGENPKNTAQMRHSCTLSGRKQPLAVIRSTVRSHRDNRDKCNKCDKPAWNATMMTFIQKP
jgi:hypothetical protein